MKAVKFNYTGLMCPVFTAFANDRYFVYFHKIFVEILRWFLVNIDFDPAAKFKFQFMFHLF